ncbi:MULTISPECIES: hypothetical protein [unclassified Pseudomonas]|uniref:hypothetical protein n=1 Tax=unclassified Pseudomonas TaxID=196821 RepID=UPI000B80FAFD|nr:MULTISPECIES: hypothetical protein [unclassified Pseudomonas]
MQTHAADGVDDRTVAPSSNTTEALIPHEKLREADTPNATLIAQNRPPAQPAVGYTHPECILERPPRLAVDVVHIDERAEFEKEFPILEGLQYCRKRVTYIRTSGASTSDTFAREHYAYKAGFAAWMRRAWKQATLEWPNSAEKQQDQPAAREEK